MRITSLLIERGDPYRNMYLPAHQQGSGLPKAFKRLLKQKAGSWDLPELPGIGGPLEKEGAISESQQKSAESIGAKRGWYGVNGATGLLQAALLAIAKPGQAVLMPRNVHKSVIHACLIGEIIPVLFEIPFLIDRGHYFAPDHNWLKSILQELNEVQDKIVAAVLIHPTYNGYAKKIEPLIKAIHKKGWVVLVDEAHGAHFATNIDESIPKSSVHSGADLVVHSLHKSAGGITQTAVLWQQGDRVDPEAIARSIGLLQTSSPSSLLLASCESAIDELVSNKGKEKFKKQFNYSHELRDKLIKFGMPISQNQDPLRIVLNTASFGLSGIEADMWFINKGIFAELPEPGCITFSLGLAPQKGLEKCLKKRWDGLLKYNHKKVVLSPFTPPPNKKVTLPVIDLRTAWLAQGSKVPINEGISKITTEMICPYPPGIPLVIPGEILDKERTSWLIQQQINWQDQFPQVISVIDQTKIFKKSNN